MKMDSHIGENTTCTVEFDYSPKEEPIYYGDMANPGCDENADIYAVWVSDDNLYEDLSKHCLQRLEQECIDYVHHTELYEVVP